MLQSEAFISTAVGVVKTGVEMTGVDGCTYKLGLVLAVLFSNI